MDVRGRATFSANELHGIELTLGQLARSDGERRRALQDGLRRQYRFYVSDFVRRGARLTVDEVERLVAQGVIRVHA
jgi:hypothetical protein